MILPLCTLLSMQCQFNIKSIEFQLRAVIAANTQKTEVNDVSGKKVNTFSFDTRVITNHDFKKEKH